MPDERLARPPLLSLVGCGSEPKRARDEFAIEVRVVGSYVRKQLVEQLLMLFAGFEDCQGKCVLPRLGVACDADWTPCPLRRCGRLTPGMDRQQAGALRSGEQHFLCSGSFGQAGRLLEQAAEGRRFEEMATHWLVGCEI